VKRPLKPDELRIWNLVAGTVHPLPGRAAPVLSPTPQAKPGETPAHIPPPPLQKRPKGPGPQPKHPKTPRPRETPEEIEPNRHHRIARERDPIAARLDLHGLDQDRARAVLEGFLRRAWDEGYRAVLVITGKGVQGDGILRRRTPEWLASPQLSKIVAGVSEAHRRHGGAGALYIALKRKPRG
jgi:DNA-nicking Smr family endonuclease